MKYDARLPKGTIALSFFPSDPLKKREVHVSPLYFTSQTYDAIECSAMSWGTYSVTGTSTYETRAVLWTLEATRGSRSLRTTRTL